MLTHQLLLDWSKLEVVYRIPKAPKRPSSNGEDKLTPRDSELDSGSKRAVDPEDQSEFGNKRGRRDSQSSSRHDSNGNLASIHVFAFRPKDSSRRLSSPQTSDRNNKFSTYRDSPRKDDRHRSSTKSSSSDDLPPNWASASSETGEVYYYHTITKQTSWERPRNSANGNGSASVPASNLGEAPNVAPMIDNVSKDDVARIIERAKLEQQALQQEGERKKKEEEEARKRKKEKERAKRHEKEQLKKDKRIKHQKEKARASSHVEEKSQSSSLSSTKATPSSSSAKATPSSSSTKATPQENGGSTQSDDKDRLSAPAEMKKELREELSAMVIKYFSRHKEKMETEEFKKHARKVIHSLV